MMARRKHDDDDKRKHKKPPKPPPTPAPAPTPPPNVNEELQAKSTQSGPAAMNAVPGSMAEANGVTDAAVYSTGPGAVVAYDYQRTGLYADEYNQQQAVEIPQATPVTSSTVTTAAMGQ